MEDVSFIKLYKNDFNSALLADDTPITYRKNGGLPYGGFIQQKPNEYFQITSSGTTPISFVGGITVDLIDCNGLTVKNIDSNFYYWGFVDSSGVNQISFAFGFIGIDYWTKQLHLRITDEANGNVWYSNGFLVTNYRSDLSTRFDYTNKTKIFNISYDLAPYIQSVRLSNCYDQTPVNKREVKQYLNATGHQTNYRTIPTFLRKYLLNGIDNFINDRLEVLFSHNQIYVDGQRVTISEFKPNEREGDTNWMTGEFLINPQGETLNLGYQLYEYLEVVSKTPEHLGVYTVDSLPNISLTFNKNISLSDDFTIKLYKGGVLQSITPLTTDTTGNLLDITPSYSFTNGEYSITIDAGLIVSGLESFLGFGATEWTFTISAGDYDSGDYSSDYLTT